MFDIDPRSAPWSQFAYPYEITRPERLLSEWVAVVVDSDYRPYFVCLAPFACRLLVHITIS